MSHIDTLLRASGRYRPGSEGVPWRPLIALIIAAGFAYGAVMGSFGGRPLQAFYSGLKIPILLAVSTAICLPSFFVLNTAMGLRDDFGAAYRGILAAQGTVAIALASLAPLTYIGYLSSADYDFARVVNGAMFALASLAGQITLTRHYRALIARNPRHRFGLLLWLSLYWFVTIQLAWMLRPFIGAPGLPTRFLREETWGNAYVVVFELVLGWLG